MTNNVEGGDATSLRLPGAAKAAGIIWVITGALVLLRGLVTLISNLHSLAFALGSIAIPAIFGIAFISVGVATTRGKAAGTLVNGIGSVVLGSMAVILGLGGMYYFIPLGVALVAAGVLAITARGPYRKWRTAGKGEPGSASRKEGKRGGRRFPPTDANATDIRPGSRSEDGVVKEGPSSRIRERLVSLIVPVRTKLARMVVLLLGSTTIAVILLTGAFGVVQPGPVILTLAGTKWVPAIRDYGKTWRVAIAVAAVTLAVYVVLGLWARATRKHDAQIDSDTET